VATPGLSYSRFDDGSALSLSQLEGPFALSSRAGFSPIAALCTVVRRVLVLVNVFIYWPDISRDFQMDNHAMLRLFTVFRKIGRSDARIVPGILLRVFSPALAAGVSVAFAWRFAVKSTVRLRPF